MFFEIASTYHQSFRNFQPYPTITDRNSWDDLDSDWKKVTVELGEKYLGHQYPYISATDFMDFSRTGNRVRFENKFFSKRHALNALVLAECVENKGRFLDDIINGIFSICEESAWQLPPHNSYIRDTKQFPLPDATAPVLDLFACETGAILGTVYYLLGKELDKVSPFITKRILHELQQRIFIPYLNSHFWWMGNGKEPMNNWTIWCTQNVLLSVFLTSDDTALKHSVFLKACKSTDYFLMEYGEDGCCDEGAQYYRHAALCLFNVMEILNAITTGQFSSLYKTAKIKNMAAYILNAHIHDKYYVNFADCSPVAGRAGVREFLFGKRTDNEDMVCFAATDFKADMPNSLLLSSENNLYYRIQNAFTIKEIKSYDTSRPIHHEDIYYPSVGLLIARDSQRHLAVKAGDNADSHNHNDVGSVTIYKNGKPFLIDVGVESYTKKTFSPQRYEIWTMQSSYHNLPDINGYQQKDGEEYRASDVEYHISESLCDITMDISTAYPKECNLLYYKRYAALRKEKEIYIRDQFSFKEKELPFDQSSKVVLNFMTYEKPIAEISQDHIQFTIGSIGTMIVKGGTLLQIEEIPITDSRLKTAWEHEIYRIQISANMDNTQTDSAHADTGTIEITVF